MPFSFHLDSFRLYSILCLNCAAYSIYAGIFELLNESFDFPLHSHVLTLCVLLLFRLCVCINCSGEAFNDNPHTIQYGACGEPGLQIQLSQQFLTDGAAGSSHTQRAKAILRQWTHYRYGVFAEHGFHNDPLYPLFRGPPGSQASGDERVTSCAATSSGLTALHAVNKTRQGEVCSLGTDQSGSPRDAVCIPYVDESHNTDIISSLMSHALNNVEYFCDEKTHDVDAPNKQNALCNETSIWEVIFRHSDFANGR